jgi:hypothetical protein
MSYTESARLSQLQATVRSCAVQNAIQKLQCCEPAQAPDRQVGNSESGRLTQLQSDLACCAQPSGQNTYVCPLPRVSATRTVQTEGAYTASKVANCQLALTTSNISAGGVTESQRLRLNCTSNVDYTTNPDARWLQYQRFFPAPCPPAQNANNLPLTQPEFGCAQVNQFPYS